MLNLNFIDLELKPKKQKIFCIELYKNERKRCNDSWDNKIVFGNKEFPKMVKHFLSDKNTIFSQISIDNNNNTLSDYFDLSEKLSTVFEDAFRSIKNKPE